MPSTTAWLAVSNSISAIIVTLAANFASTISNSRTGDVSKSSSVPLRRSSASSRMVMTGTMSRNSTAAWKNMRTSSAVRLRNSISVNVYPISSR